LNVLLNFQFTASSFAISFLAFNFNLRFCFSLSQCDEFNKINKLIRTQIEWIIFFLSLSCILHQKFYLFFCVFSQAFFHFLVVEFNITRAIFEHVSLNKLKLHSPTIASFNFASTKFDGKRIMVLFYLFALENMIGDNNFNFILFLSSFAFYIVLFFLTRVIGYDRAGISRK
jgi:hypothetical protein